LRRQAKPWNRDAAWCGRLSAGPRFDHFTVLHDHQIIGKVCNDRQVMADQHQAHVVFRHQLFQEVENLSLGGDVQRGGRLIRDQELWPQAIAIAITTRWRWPPESSCG
jgi:hypothetical protein